MSYKVEDIPGMIECLKLVTPELLVQEWGYLCHALARTHHLSRGKCRELVGEMVGGSFNSLEKWQIRHTEQSVHHLSGARGYHEVSKRVEVRMQWIEKIIRDLEGYQNAKAR